MIQIEPTSTTPNLEATLVSTTHEAQYQDPNQNQQQHRRPNLKIAVVDADSAALLQQQHTQSMSKSPNNNGSGGLNNGSLLAGVLSPFHQNSHGTGGLRSDLPSLSSSSSSASSSSRRASMSESDDDDDDSDSSVLVICSVATPEVAAGSAPVSTFRGDLNEAEQRFRVALEKTRARSFVLEEAAFEVAYAATQHGHRFLKMLAVEAHLQNPDKVTSGMMIALHRFVDERLHLNSEKKNLQEDDDPCGFLDDIAISRYQTTAALMATQKLFNRVPSIVEQNS